jgi:hypothetical protein
MEKHTDVPKDKEIKIDADDNVRCGNIVFIKPLLAQIGMRKKNSQVRGHQCSGKITSLPLASVLR